MPTADSNLQRKLHAALISQSQSLCAQSREIRQQSRRATAEMATTRLSLFVDTPSV